MVLFFVAGADNSPLAAIVGAVSGYDQNEQRPSAIEALHQSSNEAIKQNLRDVERPSIVKSSREYSAEEIDDALREIREESAQYVNNVYPLILGELELTTHQEAELLSLLIEAETAATKTFFSSGEGMNDRSAKIADIIGQSKLNEFLQLEQYRAEYAELRSLESMFNDHDVSLSDLQRHSLGEILVKTRKRFNSDVPAGMDPMSSEYIQHHLDQMDDFDRLVLELAPSVLSREQVELLFDRYQALAYERRLAIDAQLRARGNDPAQEENLLAYPPRN